MNNHNEQVTLLFFKCFRNKFIRMRIYYHLNIFNSNKFQREFNYHEINRYHWKRYLQNVCILDEDIYLKRNEQLKLPVNVVSLKFKNLDQELWDGFIPYKNRENAITSIDFGAKFKFKLKMGDIPPTITSVRLSDVYEHPLKPGDIVCGVQELKFGNRWNQPLEQDSLPYTIKSIHFGNQYNNGGCPFDASLLPSDLESLRFGSAFQQVLDGSALVRYTPKLNKLIVNSNYKHQLSFKNIPSSVTELFYGLNCAHRDQMLNYQYHLPEGITKLTLGDYITAPIDQGFIPSSVTDLSLGSNNRVEVGSIPSSVQKLDLGLSYNRPLPVEALPTSLTHLVFSYDFDTLLAKDQFVNTRNLTTIEFGAFYSRPIECGVLPVSLKTLKFARNFNPTYLKPKSIPDSVTYLQIIPNFTYDNIPASLQKLKWINFDREIPVDYFNSNRAPLALQRLISLSLGDNFNKQILPTTFPSNIKRLDLGYKYNYSLTQEVLPSKLEKLTLGQSFNQEIKEDTLPESLLTLKVYGTPKLNRKSIPQHLNSLFCLNTNNEFLKSIDLYFFFSVLKIIKFNY